MTPSERMPQRFLALTPQPEFPSTDLSEANAAVLPQLLAGEAGVESRTRDIQDYQRMLYDVAHQAIKLTGLSARHSPEEYRAFSHGFVDHETIAMILAGGRRYLSGRAVRKVQPLLMRSTSLAEAKMSTTHLSWSQQRPRSYDVIVELGERRHESFDALRARTMGASIAFELQSLESDLR